MIQTNNTIKSLGVYTKLSRKKAQQKWTWRMRILTLLLIHCIWSWRLINGQP